MRDKLGRFRKGYNWWFGKKRPGFKNDGTFKKGMIPWNKGLTIEDPRVRKYVEKNTNQINKICRQCGKNYSVNKSREKNSRFCSIKCKAKWLGEKYENPLSYYKRSHNEYIYLHSWVNREFGRPKNCEICGDKNKKRYHWANKTGRYIRKRNDWLRLCPKCHYKYDIESGIRKFGL